MGSLADHLCKVIPSKVDASELTAWKEIENLVKAEGLEAALMKRPPSSTLEQAIVRATVELIYEKEAITISEVFSNKRVLRLTRLLKHLVKAANGIPIITTNYDRLVEIAVEEAGLGVDTMFLGQFSGRLNEKESRLSFCRNVSLIKGKRLKYSYRSKAIVFKPHGSLDWYLRDGNPVQYLGHLTDIPRLIITPGQNKFRNGYESPFDLHRARANEAIDRCTRFAILGYGFNDSHLETHLSPWIRKGKPTLILTHTLSKTAEQLAFENQNVVALDSASENSVKGTRAIKNKSAVFLPDVNFWDLNEFVKNVIEP